jgi:hypothetical protein
VILKSPQRESEHEELTSRPVNLTFKANSREREKILVPFPFFASVYNLIMIESSERLNTVFYLMMFQ